MVLKYLTVQGFLQTDGLSYMYSSHICCKGPFLLGSMYIIFMPIKQNTAKTVQLVYFSLESLCHTIFD